MKIGVLGGIGPQATGLFYLKLIQRFQEHGVKSNVEFPQIIINSIPAPELTRPTATPDELVPYREGIQELVAANVDCIAMPCNTIHLFKQELFAGVSTQLLDLQEFVRNEIQKHRCVAILGTPLTVQSGLYDVPGVTYCNPTTEQLVLLQHAIEQFIIGDETQRTIVHAIAEDCHKRGAELIVLGCTEFAVMLDNTELPVLNSIDVLVEGVVAHARKKM